MNQQQGQEQGPTGLYKSISTLADIVALFVMVAATPRLFELTKRPMYLYFVKDWGRDIGEFLVWGMGAVEAYLIFMATSFLLTGGIVWLVMKIVMRRFDKD